MEHKAAQAEDATSKPVHRPASQTAMQPKSQLYLLISLIILASCLGNLSQTALNAMFTSIATDFGISVGLGQLVTTAYMLVLGITVPLITFLMRRFSQKRLTIIAIVLLLAGSLIDIVAWDFWVLVAGRVLQAVSAGITMPMMMSVIMLEFPPNRQATVMGISGIAMGFAPNIGPTIGGWMVMEAGWRSFFVLLAVICVVLLVVCAAFVKRSGVDRSDAHLDLPSFLLSTVGFGALLVGFTNASNYHPLHHFVWLPIVAGAAILAVFVLRQRRISHPLMDMGVFKSKRYVAGFISLNLLSASFMGITLILPLFIEGVWGGNAFLAGLALLPGTISALVLNPLAGVLTDRVGARPVVLVGSVCLAAGAVSMAFMDAVTPFWAILAMQFVRSAGVSLLVSPLTAWSMAELPPRIMVDGSSASSAVRQVSASIGTALMVFAVTLASVLGPQLAFQIAFGVSAVFGVATLAVNVAKVR